MTSQSNEYGAPHRTAASQPQAAPQPGQALPVTSGTESSAPTPGTAAPQQPVAPVPTFQRPARMSTDPASTTGPPAFEAGSPTGQAPTEDSSTTEAAKQEAADVAEATTEAGRKLADSGQREAGRVAAETKQQARGLLDTVSSELESQAGAQQNRAAHSLGAISKELDGMSAGSQEPGPMTELAQQGAQRAGQLSRWLEDREPRDVLGEVQSFARRRPVAFLALCGAAGVLAGRLGRGAAGAGEQDRGQQ